MTITQGEFAIITLASTVIGKGIASSVLLTSAMADKLLPATKAPNVDLECLVENYKSTRRESKQNMGTEEALL